jgi:PPM family protein phosphatase
VITKLKDIFQKKEKTKLPRVQNIQTTPLSEDQLKTVTRENVKLRPPQFLVGSGQSAGLQRDHNEDTLFAMSSVVADNVSDLPFGIYIIADGMGGHKNGELASGVAARVVAKNLVNRIFTRLLDIHPEPMDESLQETLENSFNEAQKSVNRHAPGGGTTLTCALVLGEQVTIAHVGDSRAYFIYPDGRIQRITKDHSLVQRMLDLDEITEEEAATHPQRNVLLRAIGQAEPVKSDIQTHQIPRGGFLMLCSDGLWGVIPDTEIYRIVTSNTDPVLSCNQMIEAANNAGGPDNISVILVDFYGQ